MNNVAMGGFALASIVVQGLITFAIVYVAARLAIRHERRSHG